MFPRVSSFVQDLNDLITETADGVSPMTCGRHGHPLTPSTFLWACDTFLAWILATAYTTSRGPIRVSKRK